MCCGVMKVVTNLIGIIGNYYIIVSDDGNTKITTITACTCQGDCGMF